MNKEKISAQEIIDLVARKVPVSKRQVEEFVKVLFSTIEDTLATGEQVKVKGLGTFKLQWNAPRKSVNVQTGDEIIIPGYYKVAYAPDSTLKEAVNEPFAHLEPVVLDGEAEDEKVVEEEALDPLRIFTEQAAEIKGLLSEIQALSNTDYTVNAQGEVENDAEEELDDFEEQEDDDLVEDDVAETIEPEVVMSGIESLLSEVVENQPVQESANEGNQHTGILKEEVVAEDANNSIDNNIAMEEEISEELTAKVEDEAEIVVEEKVQDESKESNQPTISPTAEIPIAPVAKTKGKRSWIWWCVASLVLIGTILFFYIYHLPFHRWTNDHVLILFAKNEVVDMDKVEESVVETPEIIEEIVSVDSLQLLFDTPREYTEFIETETFGGGDRLARLGNKYWGSPYFWVYIYEANRDGIPNPNVIPDGKLIRIPKMDPRLVDPNNPRCIDFARQLENVYLKNE